MRCAAPSSCSRAWRIATPICRRVNASASGSASISAIVMVDEGDMFGDGVNVAARLQTLAEPGEICVSASVREQVGEKLPIGFADRGQHGVKNIARPVRVYSVEKDAEPNTGAAGDPTRVPLALADRPSLAVMPFTNMSGDPDQEYFVDGIVEDIITGLSRLRWLH